MSDVTRILSQIEAGDPAATEQLLPLVYDELRKLAAGRLAQEPSGKTLQPTAGTRRRAGEAARCPSPAGATREATIFRRHDQRTGGGNSWNFNRNGRPRLGLRSGLAASGDLPKLARNSQILSRHSPEFRAL